MQKERSTLAKKIKGYSTLAGSLLAIGNVANAQVIYTDLNPDVTGSDDGANYSIDLNNDGTADFKISVSSNGSGPIKMIAVPLGSNAIAGTVGQFSYTYPSALNFNDPIGASKSWHTGPVETLASSGYFTGVYGNWFGATDKYLGLRINIGGDDSYGWARMDVSADGHTYTVKDYAYESGAGVQILAGDSVGGGVGISPVDGNEISVFSFGKTVNVKLNENSGGLITISNLLGQTIKAAEINSSLMTINLADQPIGIYLVTIEQNGQLFAKKVTLQ